MSKLSNEFEGKLAVARIDVRTNVKKVRQYGVTHTPTSFYFKHAASVNRLDGYLSYDKLAALTNQVLQEPPSQ